MLLHSDERITRTLSSFIWPFVLLLMVSGTVTPAFALDAVPGRDDILKTLRPEHPRLLATAADFAAIKTRIASDAIMKQWHDKLLRQAEALEKQPAIVMSITTGSRNVLQGTGQLRNRMYLLGMLYQLHKEQKYADLAWRDMQVAINTPDWNPKHFLGVAETTRALAIGYDWLYDALTPAQRKAIEDAILDKAFKYAIASYRGQYLHGWWPAINDNWNQVCNGGMGMGALAIADAHPKEAGEVLTNIVRLLPIAMHEYAPDGAWPEGIAYWGYGGDYNVQIIASLTTALGKDFGLADMHGYSQTAWFPILLTGPTGLAFNYGDSPSTTRSNSPSMLWFAKRFNQPYFATHYLPNARGDVLDMFWYDASLLTDEAKKNAPPLPGDHRFGNVDVFTFTNDLSDPNATWLAFKAGNNAYNHSHLDLGSFVLDALGERWAVDLGSDSYELPTYFHAKRWTYFRTRAESHNTLQISPSDKPGQDVKASAKVVDFKVDEDGQSAGAILDLTAAYRKQSPSPDRVTRHFVRHGKQVLINDYVDYSQDAAAANISVQWQMYTPAMIALNGREAILSIKDARLLVRITTPAEASFESAAALPLEGSPNPPSQNLNKGIQRLFFKIIAKQGSARIRTQVVIIPLEPGQEPADIITPEPCF